MIHYSVVIPQRDRPAELRRQLPRLRGVLDQLALPYEIVCVDDGSNAETQQALLRLAAEQPSLRVLRLDKPAGASTALSTGIAAARGQLLIAIEAGDRYSVEQIPHLIARLSRFDLVYGRRRLEGWRKFWHRVARIPRAMLLGLEVRQPDCLFWAARREAVSGIRLVPGMRRYLPWLVAKRGFRVGDIYIENGAADVSASCPPIADARPNPLDLLAAWWMCRRWRDDSAREIGPAELRALAAAQTSLKIARPDDSRHSTPHRAIATSAAASSSVAGPTPAAEALPRAKRA